MENDILVSVICTAYNHEKYISSALEGFISQITDFKYEVLINDDASTDNTAKIIKDYEVRYPNIIKATYQTENQYSKGVGIVKRFLIPQAKGTYLAWCEGDDFWIDSHKLQKQINALKAHPDVKVCAHGAKVINAVDGKFIRYNCYRKKSGIIPVEDVIREEGGIVETASLVMDKEAFMSSNYLFDKEIFHDYVFQIKTALPGGMLYLNDVMSCYRSGVPGSFCSRTFSDNDKALRFLQSKYRMLNQLNIDTNYKYDSSIQARFLLYEISAYKTIKSNRAMFKKYKEGFVKLSFKEKFAVLVKCYMPWAIRFKHKLLR